MSQHIAPVVRVHLEPHPNADRLWLVRVLGWTVVVGKSEFQEGDLAVYLPPDSVLPVEPQYEFLAKSTGIRDGKFPDGTWTRGYRIKVVKLRGEWSQGLLLHAPEGMKEGDDATLALGIAHYEPPIDLSTGGLMETPPALPIPDFDVQNFEQAQTLFVLGERVIATEKIDGAQGRFVWFEDRLWCGSKNHWWKDTGPNIWWRAARETPGLIDLLKAHPGVVLYGEVYGSVQGDSPYGMNVKMGELRFVAFDLYDPKTGEYPPPEGAYADFAKLSWVPALYDGPFEIIHLTNLRDGETRIPKAQQAREGIVIRAVPPYDVRIGGRAIAKMVSNEYLAKH